MLLLYIDIFSISHIPMLYLKEEVMKKVAIETNYIRKGVAALLFLATILVAIPSWYWGSVIFRASDNALRISVPGSFPWWLPVISLVLAVLAITKAFKMVAQDNRSNKSVSYQAPISKEYYNNLSCPENPAAFIR
ncbi:MAG: hypothetical protein ACD_9C00036G0001 [uncultured bacterium]|nr:MAG: hypothetical protein ACD_9C00036G0001 [uncultured bacterium]